MICAVLLAAGASRRMGTNKLLLPYKSKAVIRHIAETLLASGVDKVVVVTGHNPDAITEELSALPVLFAHNPDYDSGMLSSVRCGLQAIPNESKAILIALGDHPTISPSIIRQMIHAHTAGASIVVPKHGEHRGHPLLFAAHYRDAIMSRYDNTGLRGMLREYVKDVFELPVDDRSVTLDLDTPEDYARLMDTKQESI